MLDDIISIAFIADDNYIVPTSVAITSLIENKDAGTKYEIFVITTDENTCTENAFEKFASETVEIIVIKAQTEALSDFSKNKEETYFGSFSTAALLKFNLSSLISRDKIIYLDGDIIVNEDLTSLFDYDIKDFYLAAVIDPCIMYRSHSSYDWHKYARSLENYFNSGVMLLNLKRMRKENISKKLIDTKRMLKDSLLMDQDVFNIVFQESTLYLPITYNCMNTILIAKRKLFSMDDVYRLYGQEFIDIDDIENKSAIIHYASREKPWKYPDIHNGYKWYYYFQKMKEYNKNKKRINKSSIPHISVIIPVYNSEKYITETIMSVRNQTMKNIEIICINDGSTDTSYEILLKHQKEDERLCVINQINSGVSVARNLGVDSALGKYIYFIDSDDILVENALELLFSMSEKDNLDLCLFEARTFYDDVDLEAQFPDYKNFYARKNLYPDIYKGSSLFSLQKHNQDFNIVVWMQFIKRDLLINNGIKFNGSRVREDNVFSFELLMSAEKVCCIKDVLVSRRIRANSLVTTYDPYLDFAGWHSCVISGVKFLSNAKLDPDEIEMVNTQIKLYNRKSLNSFIKLPRKRKVRPFFEDPTDNIISIAFFELLQFGVSRSRKAHENTKYITRSLPYKFAKILLYIPYKAKRGVDCCRDHGVRYTITLALEKMKNRRTGG